MNNNYAKVVFPGLAVDTAFDYAVAEPMRQQIKVGQRVLVNFGGKNTSGIVVDLIEQSKIKYIKDIIKIETIEPVLNNNLLKLTRWVADYYFASWGEAMEACFMQPTKTQSNFRPEETLIEKNVELPGLLTEEQEKTLEQLESSLLKPIPKPVLLWGGTEKTRVRLYLELSETILKKNQQIVIIFPQIEMINSYREMFFTRFPTKVGVLHSGLCAKEKYALWEKIRTNQLSVILSTRMTILYPFGSLGLIIVENEHDPAFKQDQKPMYNTGEVALKRAELEKLPLLLSSTTPSVESYYHAQQGDYQLIKLDDFLGQKRLQVEIKPVTEKSADFSDKLFTPEFIEAVAVRLERREKVVIFANRLGYANIVFCRACRHTLRCPECSMPLSLNKKIQKLFCKHCHSTIKYSPQCPKCHSQNLFHFGSGVETVEELLKKRFPLAKIGRVDAGNYDKFTEYDQYDIIVGTQILQHFDFFPKATFLGILLIDLLLNLPDFRSTERTFQIIVSLMQRLDSSKSETVVMIQTYNPEHYLLQVLKNRDWDGFYCQELRLRRELKYPPFGYLTQIIVRGADRLQSEQAATDLAEKIGKYSVKFFGPAPAYRAKLRGQYRQQILLKTSKHETLIKALRKVMPNKRTSALKISTDIDPIELL